VRRLLDDPEWAGIGVVVLEQCHERRAGRGSAAGRPGRDRAAGV